jgi:YidC/Oxa1 family membrane protein insertase
MQELQPKMQELQKKYGKDKQKLNTEMMKLYKESKVNPLGCIWPMLLQLPIWIALYWAIRNILGDINAGTLVGVKETFLWMNLTQSGDFLLAILVMGTMYVVQKMSTTPAMDPKQQQMSKIMMFMMPIMFGIITLTLPSGLGLYFLVSNVISIAVQYHVTGWGTLRLPWLRGKVTREVSKPAIISATPILEGESAGDEKRRGKRKDSGRSRGKGSKRAKSQPRSGRSGGS